MVSKAVREDAGLSDDEAHLLSVGLVGMAQVTARYWLSTRDHIPREAAEQLVARLAWRGISGWPRSEHWSPVLRSPVEVKIGIQSVPRELVVETDTPADEIEQSADGRAGRRRHGLFALAMARAARSWCPRTRSPTSNSAAPEARRVGFGNIV